MDSSIQKQERIRRLQQVDVCAVSDALDVMKINGVALGLKRMWPNKKIVGQAVTVKLGLQGERTSKRHLCTAAVALAESGDIIVVDHRGRTNVAGWGGILSMASKHKGISGVIIDGACRDVDESEEAAFPVYAKANVPVTARGRVIEESYNETIEICGVEVSPGDYVIADGSGVAFIPEARIDELLERSEKIAAKERAMSQKIKEGIPVTQVMGLDYETMLNQRG